MLTNQELQDIQSRCDAATAGNLRLMDDGIVIEDDGTVIADFDSNHDDARLFIHARTDIPALIAHIEEQRNALAKAEADKAVMVDALESCLNLIEFNKFQGVIVDKARAALSSAKESPCPKN